MPKRNKSNEAWQAEFDDLAERIADLYREVQRAVSLMRVEDQLALLDKANQATSTNCPWTIYEAAQLVKGALPSREYLERQRLVRREPADA